MWEAVGFLDRRHSYGWQLINTRAEMRCRWEVAGFGSEVFFSFFFNFSFFFFG